MSKQVFNPPPLPCAGFGVKDWTQADQKQWMKSTVAKHLKSAQHEEETPQSAEEESRELFIKFCKRHADSRETFLCVHRRKINSVIQEGPQCGLVAISMVAEALCPEKPRDPGEIYKAALSRGFTKQGEMFSAQDMCDLASDILQRECLLFHGRQDDVKLYITEHLMKDQMLLIPYDRDHNNEPCTKNGTKAHWALLSGLLMPVSASKVVDQAFSKPDSEWDNLHHATDLINCERFSFGILRGDSSLENFGVFAIQGKSLHTQLWDLNSLVASNAQLSKLDPEISQNLEDYHIPEGGIESGLKGCVICVL